MRTEELRGRVPWGAPAWQAHLNDLAQSRAGNRPVRGSGREECNSGMLAAGGTKKETGEFGPCRDHWELPKT
eukprot:6392565-Pyramimonas_sp.AAC.1